MLKTLEISVLILFLVAASNFFGAVFARLGTPTMLTDYLLSLDLPRYVFLVLIMALIFVLGWPLEWVPIVLIVVPFLLPLVQKLGFDMTWFGDIGCRQPADGVAVPAGRSRGLFPQGRGAAVGAFRHLQGHDAVHGAAGAGLVLIIIFPEIALWLPRLIYGN